jgi:hypothetical protein
LLGTLRASFARLDPRKRERVGHTSRYDHPLAAPTFENRLRIRSSRVSQTSR